jgi:glucokinase
MLAGIDIGGTKISVCLGDAQGRIFSSKRIATQPLQGAKQGLPRMADLLRELLQTAPPAIQLQSIGISSPGPISTREGKMLKPPNLPGWEGTKLVAFFQREFNVPVSMNNDANAAALAEYEFGSLKGCKNLVYLTCSTGMGGGAIADGKLIQGVCDTAAEVGHFVLDIEGPLCPCGQRGCFEAYCGGAALAKRIQKEIREKNIETQILTEAKGNLEAVDITCLIAAVRKKDPFALQVWETFLLRLAQGIGVVLMNFNPEALILGTIAVHSGPLLLEPVRKLVTRFAWRENVGACRIESTLLGDQISELSSLALAKLNL